VTNNGSGNARAVNWAMIGALATVAGVVVAVLVARGAFSPGPTPTPTPGPTSSTPTVPVTPTVPDAHPPPSAVYLRDLEPTAGDTPMLGDTHIGDQDFRNSIFYNNVPLNEPNGSASACQKVAASTCQATDYSIASGRYHHFSAVLGVTDEGDSEMAQWSLSVDGLVIRSGTVALNSSPQQITVAIPRGNDLELQVSTSAYSGGAYGGLNIIWGNARLSY
jgi:hypothetical protein